MSNAELMDLTKVAAAIYQEYLGASRQDVLNGGVAIRTTCQQIRNVAATMGWKPVGDVDAVVDFDPGVHFADSPVGPNCKVKIALPAIADRNGKVICLAQVEIEG